MHFQPVCLCSPEPTRQTIHGRQIAVNGSGRAARRASLAAFRQAATDTHLLDYLIAGYRYRYLAASVFFVVILIALVQVYTTTPLYRAQARVIVEIEDDQVSSLTGVLSGENYRDPGPYYQTQFRILTGRELARRTVRRAGPGESPEFNGTGATRTQLAQTSTRSRAGWGSAPRRAAPQDGPVPEAILVAGFLSRVSVEPVKNSRLVDITFMSASPEFAARAVNQLAREYVDQNAEQRRYNVTSGLSWIEQELERQKQGRGVRARHGQLPRGAERAVARGSPEHRRRAPQPAERRRDQGQDRRWCKRNRSTTRSRR